jgi:hypothetical protein
MLKDLFWAHGRAVRPVPCTRQILPVIYRRLTIPGQPWRYSGTLPRAGHQGFKSCASPDRTPPSRSRTRPRRAAAGGFSVNEGDAPKSTKPAASLRTIGGIDALIALQGQDDPAERRRRAVKRGRTALDALDELKIEVLGGTLGSSTLLRLKSATADLCDTSGDDRLDSVLAEIELRLAVEIAKMGPSR